MAGVAYSRVSALVF
ncbi:hypothetical protein ACVCEA_07560 [Escherichia coli]